MSDIKALKAFIEKESDILPDTGGCHLCANAITNRHRHLFEMSSHKVICSCDACALLFPHKGGKYRAIPRDKQRLNDFSFPDDLWNQLGLPVNLAFFCYSSIKESPIAYYPSPVGAIESLLPIGAWEDLQMRNTMLRDVEPDVEALWVNRIQDKREFYRLPIDDCYLLVGLIKKNWEGFSGGIRTTEAVNVFFEALNRENGMSE